MAAVARSIDFAVYAVVSILAAGCTAPNPAFGTDGRSTDDASTSRGDTTTDASKSTTDMTTAPTSVDLETSGDVGTGIASETQDSTGPSSTTDPSTTDPSTTDPSTTDSSETDPLTETDPSTSGVASSETGETNNTTGMPLCEPTGSDCGTCMVELCCPALLGCDTGECMCLSGCVGLGQSASNCLEVCGLDESPKGWDALLACVLDECPNDGECPNAGN